MFKYIIIFIIISTFTYCVENSKETIFIDSKDKILFFKCSEKAMFNSSLSCEEKKQKFGQEIFDEYKKKEKLLKFKLNDILVPSFMAKSFKIDIDLERVKNFKVAYIYTPEVKGLNFRLEWDHQIKLSSSFKRDFDVSKLIENLSGTISNTFIP